MTPVILADLRAHLTKDDLSRGEVAAHALFMVEVLLIAAMAFPASTTTAGVLPTRIALAISETAVIAYAALNCSLLLTALAVGELS